MEDILDSLRRIISRWVETVSPIDSTVNPGDSLIYVDSSKRFQPGDEVMIHGPLEGEPNLIVDSIVDDTTILLSTPVYNRWSVDENPVLRKLLNGMFIEGIYLGNPAVIPMYPAITINGTSTDSEWMTLDSTRERFNIEISVFVQADTHENGYRFLLRTVKTIVDGLKNNVYPLVNDYNSTAAIADITKNDIFVRVADSSIFNTHLTDTSSVYPRDSDARCIIEDKWKSEETRVQQIVNATTVKLNPIACHNFSTDNNTILISPNRFIFNSWPATVEYGTVSKGSLLQAAVIRWFAEEEVPRNFLNSDPHLK